MVEFCFLEQHNPYNLRPLSVFLGGVKKTLRNGCLFFVTHAFVIFSL